VTHTAGRGNVRENKNRKIALDATVLGIREKPWILVWRNLSANTL